MIGLVVNSNKEETVVNEKLPTVKPGDTLEDINDQLKDVKFEVETKEEYYRNKTKRMPRHIDICYGTYNFKNYADLASDKNYYNKLANVEIKEVSLGEANYINAESFLNMFANNVTHNIVHIKLKKITLPDTTTPRSYSLEDMPEFD